MKILLVDSNFSTRKITKFILKDANLGEVLEAMDGQQAEKQLQEEEIGLVVSDWELTDSSGLELLKKIRSIPEVPLLVREKRQARDTPFIMILSDGNKEQILSAVEAEVSQCVIRPFTAETILDKISKVI